MAKIVHVFWLIIVLTGCVAPTTKRVAVDSTAVAQEALKQKEIALQENFNYLTRLFNISAPLLKASLPLCKDNKRYALGFHVANKYDYSEAYRDIAVSIWGLSEQQKIVYVTPEMPAATSGLQRGDILLSVNGQSVPSGEYARKKLTQLLQKEKEKSPRLLLGIKRGGITENIPITTTEECDYDVIFSGEDIVNAYADGKQVIITQGMMDFARSDDELALVVGHEIAHNAMAHIDAKKTNILGGGAVGLALDLLGAAIGVNTEGAFSRIGIRKGAEAYSQEYESEADYVGLYINARAGLDISQAAYFWRRMGVKHPGSISKNHAASHPSTPERFVTIEETIKEINTKKQRNLELLPNLKQ